MNPTHPVIEAFVRLGAGSLPIALLVYLVQMIRDDYEKTRRVVLSERTHARKMRFRGWFWATMLVIAGLFCLSVPWMARPGGNPPKDGSGALIPLAMTSVGCFAAAIKVWLMYRAKRISGPAQPKPPRPRRDMTATTFWRWVVGIIAVAVGIYALAPKSDIKPGDRPQPGLSVWICPGMAALGAAFVVYQWMRSRDPVWNRIYRRALDGDVPGAIAELHHEVLDNGPTVNRVNGLVVLLLMNKDYPAAVEWARKGLALGPGNDALRSNFALALVEAGQAAEAEPIFAEMAAREGLQVVYLTNHAYTLATLRRFDEAESQLKAAEANIATVVLSTRGYKSQMREAIASVRTRIAEARGEKGETGLFPKL